MLTLMQVNHSRWGWGTDQEETLASFGFNKLLPPFQNKVTFGENSLKLHQTSWNVARNNVNVGVDELPSQITIYTCITIDIWTRQRWRTSTRFYALRCHRPKWRASSEIRAKSFQLYYGHPQLPGKHLVRAMQCTQFRAKSAKNDLMDFSKT